MLSPAGTVCTVIATVDPVTLIEQEAEAVPLPTPVPSATFAVKLNNPVEFGIPVIAPVTGFRVSPPGSAPGPIENVYGNTPPLPSNAELYDVPFVPVLAGQPTDTGSGGNVPEYVTGTKLIIAFPGLANRNATEADCPGLSDVTDGTTI